MQATLVVVEPDIDPREYRVQLPLTIGRGRDSRLKLMHALVSRRHCELFEDDGKLMVRDLGSLNGTFVSGERVETAPLPPGGLLTIGAVTFRAVYGDESAGDSATIEHNLNDTATDTRQATSEETSRAAPDESAASDAAAEALAQHDEFGLPTTQPGDAQYNPAVKPAQTQASQLEEAEAPQAESTELSPESLPAEGDETLPAVGDEPADADEPISLEGDEPPNFDFGASQAESQKPAAAVGDDPDLDDWFSSLELDDDNPTDADRTGGP